MKSRDSRQSRKNINREQYSQNVQLEQPILVHKVTLFFTPVKSKFLYDSYDKFSLHTEIFKYIF